MIKSLLSRLIFASLTAVILLATAQAQQQPNTTTPVPQEDREKVIINEVRIPITVLDKKGLPVAGLTKEDFLIFEDKKPQQIAFFSNEQQQQNQPLYVGVLMDTSSSTAGKLKFEQEAATDFIYTVARPRKDLVAFLTFDDEVKLLQDFTPKLDLVVNAISKVKKPGNQTSLFDAVWQFCDEKMRGATGRRAIVIITDGDDTYSRATLRDAIDIAQRTETPVFAISTKAGFAGVVPGVEAGTVSDRGDSDLERLCAETGGRAFFTGDRLALERSFTKIAKELQMQYVVTYKPSNDRYDGSFRQVEVKLTGNRNGLKVRTRKGYTALTDHIGVRR
jgi:Ca-activated chloride channel family protein